MSENPDQERPRKYLGPADVLQLEPRGSTYHKGDTISITPKREARMKRTGGHVFSDPDPAEAPAAPAPASVNKSTSVAPATSQPAAPAEGNK